MARPMAFFTAWATVIVTTTTCYYTSTTCPPISRGYLLRLGVTHQFYPGPMRDHVLKGATFRNISCRTYVICATYCLLDDECKSFNFCMDDELCQLNSAVYSENKTALQKSSDCLYFDELFHEQHNDDQKFMPSTSSTAKLLCQTNFTTEDSDFTVLRDASEPLRLEFTAVSYSDDLSFYMGYASLDAQPRYVMHFNPTPKLLIYNDTTQFFSQASQQWKDFEFIVGEPIVATLDAGQFSLTSDDGLFKVPVPFVNSTWEVYFGSLGFDKADWIVNHPCN